MSQSPSLSTEDYLRSRVRVARAAYDTGRKEPTRVYALSKEVDDAEAVLNQFLEARELEMSTAPVVAKTVSKPKPKYLGDATQPTSSSHPANRPAPKAG